MFSACVILVFHYEFFFLSVWFLLISKVNVFEMCFVFLFVLIFAFFLSLVSNLSPKGSTSAVPLMYSFLNLFTPSEYLSPYVSATLSKLHFKGPPPPRLHSLHLSCGTVHCFG